MTVRRIVANLEASDPGASVSFYRDILGLEMVMDHGWIVTFAGPGQMAPQVSLASQGGSGAPVPALSVEVDDLDEVLARVRQAGVVVSYGPVQEPWGVRRFLVRDPGGRLVNILSHA